MSSLCVRAGPGALARCGQVLVEEAAMWEQQGRVGFLRFDYDPATQAIIKII